jgi:hypothetical protein
MAEQEQDQVVFVMVQGAPKSRFYKSVEAGSGREAMEDVASHDDHWIEVDDAQWIVRDHVLYAYVETAGEERRADPDFAYG